MGDEEGFGWRKASRRACGMRRRMELQLQQMQEEEGFCRYCEEGEEVEEGGWHWKS